MADESTELPKALTLRMNSRMAVVLQLAVNCAGLFAAGNIDTAQVLARTMRWLQDEFPDDLQKLKDSLVALTEVVPPHVLDEMRLTVMSTNELNAAVERSKRP